MIFFFSTWKEKEVEEVKNPYNDIVCHLITMTEIRAILSFLDSFLVLPLSGGFFLRFNYVYKGKIK